MERFNKVCSFIIHVPVVWGCSVFFHFILTWSGVNISLLWTFIPSCLLFFQFPALPFTNKPIQWKHEWIPILIVIVIFACGVIKGLYWPPVAYDTIYGYTLSAKAILVENQYNHSLFTHPEISQNCGPRMAYPPLLSGAMALSEVLTGEMKFFQCFIWLSFNLLIWLIMRQVGRPGIYGFILVLVILTPEWITHGSLALTNYPAAYFVFLSWSYLHFRQNWRMAMLCLCLAIFTRSDQIMWSFLLLPYFKIEAKFWWKLLLLLTPIMVYMIWSVFLNLYLPYSPAKYFSLDEITRLPKIIKVISACWKTLSEPVHFGIIGYLMFPTILTGLFFKHSRSLSLGIGLSLLAYVSLFIMMNDADGQLYASGGGWISSGFKRGIISAIAPIGILLLMLSNTSERKKERNTFAPCSLNHAPTEENTKAG